MLVLTALSALVPSVLAAQDADYQALTLDAVAAENAGDFEAAHDLLQKAYEVFPNARALRGMGLESFQAGHYARAIREFSAALVHPARPLDEALRANVQELLIRARAKVGIVHLRVRPESAQVFVDGESEPHAAQESLTLDTGPQKLRLSAPGCVAQELGVHVTEGSQQVISVTLVPLNHVIPASPVLSSPVVAPRETKPALPSSAERAKGAWRFPSAVALAGLAGALGLTSGGLYLGERKRIGEIGDACRHTERGFCTAGERDQEVQRARLQALHRSAVALGAVAAASALGAAGIYVWQRFQPSRAVHVGVTPHAILVRAHF